VKSIGWPNGHRGAPSAAVCGSGIRTEDVSQPLVNTWTRSTALHSRRRLPRRSRRSSTSLRRPWYVQSLFTRSIVCCMSFSACPIDPSGLRDTTDADNQIRAPRTSASTPSSTRRFGKPASRAFLSVCASASPVSETTRRAPRRSCTRTCRPSTLRTPRVCRPPSSRTRKGLVVLAMKIWDERGACKAGVLAGC